jgi:aerobic carbon-monoxide dehydrogenase large subunit
MGLFGKPQPRIEDHALVTGQGRFIDDIVLPGALHLTLARSPMAHGRLTRVGIEAARAMPGVAAVFLASDLPEPARVLPDTHPNPALTHPKASSVLAFGKVRYVGEPVAAVLAEDRYLAEDAAELIEFEIDPLPAVVDLDQATAEHPPALVHEDVAANIAARLSIAMGDTDAAFAGAPHVVKGRFDIHRGSGQAIETRGVIAHMDRNVGRLIVWSTSQVPFVLRTEIARVTGLGEEAIQVISPDVGGGFGYKGLPYVEDVLVPYLALRLGRPVKWIEDRREHLIAGYHERSQLHETELAVDGEGRILAVRGTFKHDAGAYTPWGPVVPLLTFVNVPGSYKVPAYRMQGLMVYTNGVPVVPVRGVGRSQACFVMEQLLDLAADRVGLDPAEIRLRNLIQPEEYPYSVGFKARDGTMRTYDSGNVPALLRRAQALVRYEERRREQAGLRAQGRFVGLGLACAVEESGLGPYEEASVSIETDGFVVVRHGTPSQGQGQRTIFGQIVADKLGVPFERVKILAGNTDLVRYSIGTYASRVAVVTGSAIFQACDDVRVKASALAADLLEAKPNEIDFADGFAIARGTNRRLPLAELAKASLGAAGTPLKPGQGPGLGGISSYCPPMFTYPTGAHAAVVEVDIETGQVRILQYAAVQDFGNRINPMIVDGQVIGGFAHGLGNALLERMVYDEQGQILTGTLSDYLLPTALDVPRIDVDYVDTPTPLNPLGVKGAGQGGTIPVPAAIASAIADALKPLGVRVHRVPVSPAELLAAIKAAAPARAA